MGRVEKTVFISYRRTNFYTALSVYQDLTANGYDVYLDLQNDYADDFEEINFENIKARAHFLVILSPSALEECNEPGDWLHRTIELAIDQKRNIVLLLLEGFEFDSPKTIEALNGKLSHLKDCNGLQIYTEDISKGMEKLRHEYLNIVPDNLALKPLSDAVEIRTLTHKNIFNKMHPIKEKELKAERWFERGYVFVLNKNFPEAIRCFSQTLRIQPKFADAYHNRGLAREKHGDLEGALADFDQTLRFQPNFPKAYINRGNAYSRQGAFKAAISDYDQALRMQPDLAEAYLNRGNACGAQGDIQGAVRDYDKALHIRPDYAEVYNKRGIEHYNLGNLDSAINDYDEAIRIQPDYTDAYHSRGLVHSVQGNLNDAIANFMRAIHLQPDYAAAYYSLAKVLEKKNKYQAALNNYQKYLYYSNGSENGTQEKVKEIILSLRKKIRESS